MSLSLFRYSTNVTVVPNFCDAVSNFYNLQLLMPVSEDQPPDYKFTYNLTYKFLMASLEIKVTQIVLVTKTHPSGLRNRVSSCRSVA